MIKKFEATTSDVWQVNKNEFPKNGDWENKLKFLLRYGVLAPSGHNSQPWSFEIYGNKLKIEADYSRKRQAVDPKNREMFISVGAAGKNIELAANYFGMLFEKTIDKKSLIYNFSEGKSLADNMPLFEAITKRNTNRENFLEKEIDGDMLKQLSEVRGSNSWIKIIENKQDKKALANLIHDADLVWYKSKDLVDELEGWLRDDVDSSNGDGVPTGVLNLYKMATEVKYLFSQDNGLAKKRAEEDRQMVLKTPVMAAVISTDDTVENWIEAGETYQQLALKLTSLGLDNGFFNTVVELNGQRAKLENRFGLKGKVQMVLRIGYADKKANQTSRRSVDDMTTIIKN